MSRFPPPFELAAREDEHEDLVRRVLAMGPLRYGRCDEIGPVIVDRDPGDENDTAASGRGDR
jgi:hypothetical protein